MDRKKNVQISQEKEDASTGFYFAKTFSRFELSFHYIIRILLDLITVEIMF